MSYITNIRSLEISLSEKHDKNMTDLVKNHLNEELKTPGNP